jgi:hypothetical protein
MHAGGRLSQGTVPNTAATCHRTAPPRLGLPSESRKKSAWRLTRRCSSFGSISLTSNRCADTAFVMLMGIEPQFSKLRSNQDSARACVSTTPVSVPLPPPRPPAKHTCVLGEDAHYGLLGASVRQSRHEPEDGMRCSSHDARLQGHANLLPCHALNTRNHGLARELKLKCKRLQRTQRATVSGSNFFQLLKFAMTAFG